MNTDLPLLPLLITQFAYNHALLPRWWKGTNSPSSNPIISLDLYVQCRLYMACSLQTCRVNESWTSACASSLFALVWTGVNYLTRSLASGANQKTQLFRRLRRLRDPVDLEGGAGSTNPPSFADLGELITVSAASWIFLFTSPRLCWHRKYTTRPPCTATSLGHNDVVSLPHCGAAFQL